MLSRSPAGRSRPLSSACTAQSHPGDGWGMSITAFRQVNVVYAPLSASQNIATRLPPLEPLRSSTHTEKAAGAQAEALVWQTGLN